MTTTPSLSKTKRAEHTISARLITIDNDPTVYLTAEGAAALLQELRRMKIPVELKALFKYTDRGLLPVAGYLQGSIALYRPADVQALAASLRTPTKRQRGKAAEATPASDNAKVDVSELEADDLPLELK